MKKTGVILFCLFSANILFCQVPQFFRYQAVIRNSQGQAIAGKNVDLQLKILKGESLEAAYSETVETSTNEFGLVNLMIGKGNPNGDDFSTIKWEEGPFFVEIGLKNKENEYDILGTTPLLAVPFAIMAADARFKDDADADPFNELQRLTLQDNKLVLSQSDTIIDLSFLLDGVSDADTLPGNELVDSVKLKNNRYIVIYENQNMCQFDLNELIEDEDADTLNEIINSAYLEGNKLVIDEGRHGITNFPEVNLSDFDQHDMNIEDADADSLNEIQQFAYHVSTDNLIMSYPPSVINTKGVSLHDLRKDNQLLSVDIIANDSLVMLSIENGSPAMIDLADNDSNIKNEIQGLYSVLEADSNAAGIRIKDLGTASNGAVSKLVVDNSKNSMGTAFEKLEINEFVNATGTTHLTANDRIGLLKDGRDGHIYRTKFFGDTWWMCDDLKFEGESGYGEYHQYNDFQHAYGKYYDFNEKDTICPEGWELPDTSDFYALEENAGGTLEAGGTSGADFVNAEYYYVYGSGYTEWGEGIVYHAADLPQTSAIELTSDSFADLYKDILIKARVRCIKKEE